MPLRGGWALLRMALQCWRASMHRNRGWGGQGLSGLAAQEEQRKRYPRQDVKRHRHAGTAQRSISKTSHAPKSGKGALERRLSVEEFNAVLERP